VSVTFDFNKPVTALPGVGRARAAQLQRLNISTVRDLLYHFPRAYQNRGEIYSLEDAAALGRNCATILTVGSNPHTAMLQRGKTLTKFTAFDESGKCTVLFFNQPYVKEMFSVGSSFRFWGLVTRKGRTYEMSSPSYEPYYDTIKLPDFMPIYPLTEGLSQKILANIIGQQLMNLPNELPDIIPQRVREKLGLIPLSKALREIHIPTNYDELDSARKRFVFEELYIFSLGMAITKSRMLSGTPPEMKRVADKPFLSKIGFELTGAQRRTVEEICADMTRGDRPMTRLVAGDVGSGKTVCAAYAMFLAVANGYQCALMVPTEILAMQHYMDLSELFSKLGYRCELLVGSKTAAQKRKIKKMCADGEVEIVIGTHALLTDDTVFKNLGLVVTDEQHRFGVMQRAKLTEKGKDIHTLVMSATPIPRTLALIMYGDLDISIIDEMPPGRQKVDTFVVDESYRERLNKFIAKQIENGNQVYIVCPAVDSEEDDGVSIGINYKAERENSELSDLYSLINARRGESGAREVKTKDAGESKSITLKSAVQYAKSLQETVFPNYRVGFVHGKMSGKDKDKIMSDFYNKKIDILVSTTVIEVGVNVPTATLMIVENAERFGLSQLHQLRGRVGRGKDKSYCVLVSDTKSERALERLNVMKQESNGYKIAEKDLIMRGPGDFFPTLSGEARQHGGLKLKLAGLCDDIETLKAAAVAAAETLADDKKLQKPENVPARLAVENLFQINANTFN